MSSSNGRRFPRGVPILWTMAMAWFSLSALLPPFAAAVEIKVFTTEDGLPSNWVTALAPTPEGKLWVGTGNAGAYLLDPATGKGTGYRASNGLASDEVASIALFGGKVYVGTASGLSVFDGRDWSTTTNIGNVTMRNVRLAASPDGKQLWACSVYLAGGTVKFDGNRWEFMGGKGRGLFNDVQGFAFLPGGVVMGDGAGIPYFHAGTEVKPMSEGLPPGNIFSIAAKGETLILGSSRGLFEHAGGTWSEVLLPPGIARAPVFSIAVREGRTAAGSENGLLVFEDGKAKSFGTADGLPAQRVIAVAFVDDKIAAGTARGLALVAKW